MNRSMPADSPLSIRPAVRDVLPLLADHTFHYCERFGARRITGVTTPRLSGATFAEIAGADA